jgi:hypothetical protein
MLVTRLVIAALLPLGPAIARAQTPPPAQPPMAASGVTASGGGLEIGALSSVALIVPAFGAQLSVSVTRRAAVEVSSEIAPWLIEDSGDFWVAAQVQVRLPFRERPCARRSLVVGVTSFTVIDQWSSEGRGSTWDWDQWLRPHAGISWQWQKSAHVDLRLDVQGVVVGTTAPFVVPRVAMSAVWRRQGGRS